jgi:pimeloyl-ACP methyl ester carboxylesterase
MIGYSVQYQEIDIFNSKYKIKANLIIPSNEDSKRGIILAHGGIVNRQSLIRNGYSLGDYLCKELDTYVISPDFLGDTIHYNDQSYENFSEILNITSDYLVETYGLNSLMGFGHSLGSFILSKSLETNNYLSSIVTYGGPIRELYGTRQTSFISYLINYLTSYDYSINIKNMIGRIFDEETCRYLENVMLKDDEYCSNNYVFDFNSNLFKYFKEIVDNYLDSINIWNKPALLLFGTNDGITKRTLTFYKNKQLDPNIQMMEIPNASHITPCMASRYQLSKLRPIVDFYESVLNPYKEQYIPQKT